MLPADWPCYDFLMPTDHIVALLIAERDKLNRAIEALSEPVKRRGRPPKNPVATADYSDPTMPEWGKPAKKKARTWSAAQKKAAAERMKARWAVKKKADAKSKPKAARKAKKAAKAA
jgi:hypothetical protein